ncbi:MAG: hypothetical protein ACYCU3_18145, partial [Streptosporangiaceae bacterium]
GRAGAATRCARGAAARPVWSPPRRPRLRARRFRGPRLRRLGVSRLGVSRLGVSRLGVSRLGVSRLGVSRLGVSRRRPVGSTSGGFLAEALRTGVAGTTGLLVAWLLAGQRGGRICGRAEILA